MMKRYKKNRGLGWLVGLCSLALPVGLHAEEKGGEKKLVPVKYAPPVELNDGLDIGSLDGSKCDIKALTDLVSQIRAGQHENIFSLLIAKDNKFVFEYYMNDGKIDKPHMLMSITKNMISFAIIKAIEEGVIKSVDEKIVDFYPDLDKTRLVKGADQILIKHCLSMQSGIRLKGERAKAASKFCGNRTPTRSKIVDTVPAFLYFSNPILTGERYKYQGVDPSILSNVLYMQTKMNAVEFMDKHYFKPMQISPNDYAWNVPSVGLPGSGAGCQLTSRAMMKLGLMTEQKGMFNKKRILSEKSVAELIKPCVPDSPGYGYYWRTNTFTAKGKEIKCHSCRGAGGQFILVMPELDLVVVATGRVKKQTTAIKLTEQVIVPAFIK